MVVIHFVKISHDIKEMQACFNNSIMSIFIWLKIIWVFNIIYLYNVKFPMKLFDNMYTFLWLFAHKWYEVDYSRVDTSYYQNVNKYVFYFYVLHNDLIYTFRFIFPLTMLKTNYTSLNN